MFREILLTELAFFRQSRSQRGKALFHTTVLQYKQSRFHHFIYLFFHFHINSASGSGQKFWIHADPDPGLQHWSFVFEYTNLMLLNLNNSI